MWVWIAIALGSFLGLSLIVGLAFARILGTIGRAVSELYKTEDWATMPPTRAASEAREEEQEEAEERPRGNVARRRQGPSVPVLETLEIVERHFRSIVPEHEL